MFRQLLQRVSGRLPGRCMVCHAWPTQPVCDTCVARFAQPVLRCTTCALPVPPGITRCGACITNPPPLDACVAAVSYAYPWARLIVDFKFHQHPGRAGVLALLLRHAPWAEPALDLADVVLPMPLSRARLQQRGFNQALLLAQQLAPGKTEARVLLRVKDAAPQSLLKREQRLANVRDAFLIDPLQMAAVRGKRVVLVDDVMTSGASLFAASRVLRAAGASHITGLVVARTAAD
jgi:ComF family protein